MRRFWIALVFATPLVRGADSCDPAEQWERMIKAKGGREKLLSVSSFVARETHTWWAGLAMHRLESRTLFVPPGFLWHWFDDGDRRLGVRVSAYDLSINPIVRASQITFLPEWRGFKPDLKMCEMSGGITYLHLELTSVQLRIHLAPDGLPSQIEQFDGGVRSRYEFTDYRRIDGLVLPRSIRQTDGLKRVIKFHVDYEVNPKYDPAILHRVPSERDDPEAWRPK